jgi:hypothetical protein
VEKVELGQVFLERCGLLNNYKCPRLNNSVCRERYVLDCEDPLKNITSGEGNVAGAKCKYRVIEKVGRD